MISADDDNGERTEEFPTPKLPKVSRMRRILVKTVKDKQNETTQQTIR